MFSDQFLLSEHLKISPSQQISKGVHINMCTTPSRRKELSIHSQQGKVKPLLTAAHHQAWHKAAVQLGGAVTQLLPHPTHGAGRKPSFSLSNTSRFQGLEGVEFFKTRYFRDAVQTVELTQLNKQQPSAKS